MELDQRSCKLMSMALLLIMPCLQTTLAQNHVRAQPFNAALVEKMNLEKSLAFYKDRFADASDFTFIFVGSFDLPTMRPLVEQYGLFVVGQKPGRQGRLGIATLCVSGGMGLAALVERVDPATS